jgi:N-acetylmuramoyl-L-alanine amidase
MTLLFKHIPANSWRRAGLILRSAALPELVLRCSLAPRCSLILCCSLVLCSSNFVGNAQSTAGSNAQGKPVQGSPVQGSPAQGGGNTPLSPAPMIPKPAAQPRFLVVLDAAHGGDDSGAQLGASEAEKTLTLALSVRLRSLLSARGISAVTTRESNINLDANSRAEIANHAGASHADASHAGAAACLSLHASEAGSGVHIYVSSLSPAPITRFLPWKTAQGAYVNRSLRLAGTVNSALEHTSISGGGTPGGTEVGSSSGAIPATLGRVSLPGLDSMTCPAVAIEMAPIRGSDRKVVTEVTDSEYQKQLVEALAAALLAWKVDGETGEAKQP